MCMLFGSLVGRTGGGAAAGGAADGGAAGEAGGAAGHDCGWLKFEGAVGVTLGQPGWDDLDFGYIYLCSLIVDFLVVYAFL